MYTFVAWCLIKYTDSFTSTVFYGTSNKVTLFTRKMD